MGIDAGEPGHETETSANGNPPKFQRARSMTSNQINPSFYDKKGSAVWMLQYSHLVGGESSFGSTEEQGKGLGPRKSISARKSDTLTS